MDRVESINEMLGQVRRYVAGINRYSSKRESFSFLSPRL